MLSESLYTEYIKIPVVSVKLVYTYINKNSVRLPIGTEENVNQKYSSTVEKARDRVLSQQVFCCENPRWKLKIWHQTHHASCSNSIVGSKYIQKAYTV